MSKNVWNPNQPAEILQISVDVLSTPNGPVLVVKLPFAVPMTVEVAKLLRVKLDAAIGEQEALTNVAQSVIRSKPFMRDDPNAFESP